MRARKMSGDELGLLTDAFNQMLTRIEEQTVALQEREARKRREAEATKAYLQQVAIEGRALVALPEKEAIHKIQRSGT